MSLNCMFPRGKKLSYTSFLLSQWAASLSFFFVFRLDSWVRWERSRTPSISSRKGWWRRRTPCRLWSRPKWPWSMTCPSRPTRSSWSRKSAWACARAFPACPVWWATPKSSLKKNGAVEDFDYLLIVTGFGVIYRVVWVIWSKITYLH